MNGNSDSAADKIQTLPKDVLSESRLELLTSDSIAGGVMVSVIGWACLYGLLCTYFPRYTNEWHCRSVTVLHASIVIILSAWSVFVQGPWPFTDPGNCHCFFVIPTC